MNVFKCKRCNKHFKCKGKDSCSAHATGKCWCNTCIIEMHVEYKDNLSDTCFCNEISEEEFNKIFVAESI